MSSAVVAAIMKLKIYIEFYNPGPDTKVIDLWYESMIWAVTEHGLSLFAATILAIRPFFTFAYKTYGSISSKLGYGSGSRKDSTVTGASFRMSKVSSTGPDSLTPTEMDTGIGVRRESDTRSDDDLEHGVVQPFDRLETYGGSEGIEPRARRGSKAQVVVESDDAVR